MKGAIIKAYFNVFENGGKTYIGQDYVVKTFQGVDDTDLNNQISHDISKYGYTKVEPLTTKQYEELLEKK
jgi:hypothetical protein